MLRHSRHVGGQKQKISNLLLLFVHQPLYIAALLSMSLQIGCKPADHLSHFLLLRQRQWRPRQQRSDWLTEEKWSWRTIHMRHLLSALKSELSFIVLEPINNSIQFNNSTDYKHLQSYNISADCQQSTVRKHLSHEVSHLTWFRYITWHIT